MNFLKNVLSFVALVSGLSLIFLGISFVNNIKYNFVPPLCVISGFAIFFCSMIIFEYEPKKKSTYTDFVIDSKDTVSV